MSHYRVSVMLIDQHKSIKTTKFDNKEDAEHYAKNQSVADTKNIYEVQESTEGDFEKIKAYLKGQEM